MLLNRWIFEKYDGVRAFWNPLKKRFYSRHGNVFSFPQEIVDAMPTDIFLDGELWYILPCLSLLLLIHRMVRFGRDNFQEAMKISNRKHLATVDWSRFKYMVFDTPKHKGTYEQRYSHLGTQNLS